MCARTRMNVCMWVFFFAHTIHVTPPPPPVLVNEMQFTSESGGANKHFPSEVLRDPLVFYLSRGRVGGGRERGGVPYYVRAFVCVNMGFSPNYAPILLVY